MSSRVFERCPLAGEVFRPRILVAEDEPAMRRLLVGALVRAGYEVEGAESGLLLLRALCRLRDVGDPPALIVSDVRMPGLDGMQLVDQVRGWGWTIPFLLITAFCDDDLLDRAWAVGATLVLSKPFPMADLVAVVSRLAPRYRYAGDDEADSA
jgi:CheY-like chemotaxis protein